MIVATPFMKRTAAIVRRNIRVGRESGSLPVPAGARVSVTCDPRAQCSTIDVRLCNVPSEWLLMDTRDPCGNPSKTVSPDARSLGRMVVDMIREESGDAYGCSVYADDVIIASWLS
jgi:hypothetical protein